MGLQPHQQRVVDEKKELDDKREKLFAFFSTPTFRGLDQAERNLLTLQYSVMGVYSEILRHRIAAFGDH
jgi:hypothetical protein